VNGAGARLRGLARGPDGGRILAALAGIHMSDGVLSAFAIRATGVRTGALVLDALAPVILGTSAAELPSRLGKGAAALDTVRYLRRFPDDTVSTEHLRGAPLAPDVVPLEPIDVPSYAEAIGALLRADGTFPTHALATPGRDPATAGQGTTSFRLICHQSPDRLVYDARSSEMVIGRSGDCDLVLDDPKVSKRHARIVLGEDGARILDLGSRNGTMVNGRPVSEAPLVHGDVIVLGRFIATFERS
jgi:FHA domain-containing protein